MRTVWTDAQTRILIDDWLLGRSVAEIAEKIGKTKNAVTGKAQRLYLPLHKNATAAESRGRTSPKAKQPRPERARAERAPPPLDIPQEIPDLPTAPSPDIPNGRGFCAWPLWAHREKISHLYCNEPCRLGSSYCPQHHAKCHISRVPAYLRVAGKGKAI